MLHEAALWLVGPAMDVVLSNAGPSGDMKRQPGLLYVLVLLP